MKLEVFRYIQSYCRCIWLYSAGLKGSFHLVDLRRIPTKETRRHIRNAWFQCLSRSQKKTRDQVWTTLKNHTVSNGSLSLLPVADAQKPGPDDSPPPIWLDGEWMILLADFCGTIVPQQRMLGMWVGSGTRVPGFWQHWSACQQRWLGMAGHRHEKNI